ncbi:unnamed protein product [Miscanthus lutarioriparius]|uniref:Cytochrome P450 n=1 Tax=Miscanthus lutarioriparius TaxID=422564 RepID=A0A811N0Z8_9POAL|nr:unnamed protein product [Miscanthus lutarioriparius]
MAEFDAGVGRDRLVTESDMRDLSYLKACIREAFRLHPYHSFNPSCVAIGQNPRAFDDPLEFRPERHLLLAVGRTASGVVVWLVEPKLWFISFSTGRRGCPGLSLGTLITVMLLARLLQGFHWSKPPGVDRIQLREAAASLVLADPLVLQATPRLPAHLYESETQ